MVTECLRLTLIGIKEWNSLLEGKDLHREEKRNKEEDFGRTAFCTTVWTFKHTNKLSYGQTIFSLAY